MIKTIIVKIIMTIMKIVAIILVVRMIVTLIVVSKVAVTTREKRVERHTTRRSDENKTIVTIVAAIFTT